MLQKLRGNNSKGFTLIELMIVIAIIGILAAIAIPNFISYRNKAFCSAAESDANSVAAALGDYFSVPSRTSLPAADPTVAKTAGLELSLTGANTGTIADWGPADLIDITVRVTDVSNRCPSDYRQSQSAAAATATDPGGEGWNAFVFGANL